MKPLQKILVLAGLISLAGCQLIDLKKFNNEVSSNHDEASRLAASAKQAKPIGSGKTAPIQHVNGLWLPTKKVVVDTRNPVTPELSRKITVNRSFAGIEDAAERITILTGIPVTVTPDAAGAKGQPSGAGTGSFAGTAAPIGVTVPSIGADGSTHAATPTLPQIPGAVNLVYNGTLSGFLDVVAARYSVNWDWYKNNIRFFRVTSKTFRIAALPGDTTLSATVSAQSNNQAGGSSGSGSGSSGTSSGGTSQSTNNNQVSGVSFNGLSVWKDIENSIKTMLTPLGKVVVTPATGTITVTDTPKILAQVEQLIDQQNNALGRQVAVNVRVLSVQLDNSDNYGIRWDLVHKNLTDIGVTLSSGVGQVATGAATLVLSAPPKNSNFQGSDAIFSALSTQGRVSQVTSATITTLNNQPSPLQVGKQTSYLASSETTSAGLGNITTTLTPGSITTGFSMNLVPHILDDNKLLLQYAVNLSQLTSLEKITSGGTTASDGTISGGASIQVPNIDTRNFLQRVALNSGDTLVVAGFEQSDVSAESQGVGNAEVTALGGSKKNQQRQNRHRSVIAACNRQLKRMPA